MKQRYLGESEFLIRTKIIGTVCTIVGCNPTDLGGHFCDESNNSIDLEIDELLLKKLLSMTSEEKSKLRKLDIDYFIADFITVYLERPRGKSFYE